MRFNSCYYRPNPAKSNDSLKDQFHSLAREQHLDYKIEYFAKVTVNGKSIESTSCESAEKAERQILLTAIEKLQNFTKAQSAPADESMIEEPTESELVLEIKQVGATIGDRSNTLSLDFVKASVSQFLIRSSTFHVWFDGLSFHWILPLVVLSSFCSSNRKLI